MQNTPPVYPALTDSYPDNVALLDRILRVEESFDLIKKPLKVGKDEMTLYYIDGFIKDTVMMKLMMSFLTLQDLTTSTEERGGVGTLAETAVGKSHLLPALRFCARALPYVETDVTDSTDTAVQMVLSGAAVMVGSPFGRAVVVIDARSYPARDTAEPEGDKVMRGARDGFVETLIFNTALIRRRIPSVIGFALLLIGTVLFASLPYKAAFADPLILVGGGYKLNYAFTAEAFTQNWLLLLLPLLWRPLLPLLLLFCLEP